uniref:Uncharacterized protein n=1 Tax=Cucumis melo TaxID=3656 RepID=A0A9I9EM32_CUCME
CKNEKLPPSGVCCRGIKRCRRNNPPAKLKSSRCHRDNPPATAIELWNVTTSSKSCFSVMGLGLSTKRLHQFCV